MRGKLLFSLLIVFMLALTACVKPFEPVPASAESVESTESTAYVSEPVSDEVVVIADPVLEQLVRDKIGKSEGDILASDMANLYSLNINNQETPVAKLDGMEYAVNLSDFSYRYGELESLSPIANCRELSYLNVSYSTVAQSPVDFNTPVLERVGFTDTAIPDFSFLQNVTSMTNVTFSQCEITSIAFLENSAGLEEVNLSDNSIADLNPLSGKIELTSLRFDKNEVTDLDPLSSCIKLNYINISYNHVTNLAPIMQLADLQEVRAYEELDQRIIDRAQIQALIDRGITVDYHA